MHINIDEGEAFFSHEISVNYGPTQFVLDFKNITPRIDMRSKEAGVLALKHNVVLLDTLTAKNLAEMLAKIVKKYEKDFGKIEKSEAVKKYEKKHKKKNVKKKVVENYFG